MIARFALLSSLFLIIFFGFFWVVFRTKLVTKQAVLEALKVGAVAFAALIATIWMMGFILLIDKLS